MPLERKGRGGRRPGAGRPPAAPEERRGNRVTVWLTNADKGALDRLARVVGLTVGGAAYEALITGLRVLERRCGREAPRRGAR
jgi:hypothetical protein